MMNEHFVPVAIDINIVIRKKDAEGEFFRHIAEQGHYAGRTKPTATRQGHYVVGIDGELLHSSNPTRYDRIIALMNRALAKWGTKKNQSLTAFGKSRKIDSRFEIEFPDGGLILRETMRDLPRSDQFRQTTEQHNFDHLWLSKIERDQFVPASKKVGDTWEIPSSTAARIAQFHTVDQVRGEADSWNRDEVKASAIQAEVADVAKSMVTVKLTGTVKCRKESSGKSNPYNNKKVSQAITNDLQIRGWLTYDIKAQHFLSFDMVAAGMRTGADVYNFRWNDLGPAPIGFAFELLENRSENRIRPKFLIWNYFGNR